MDKISTTAGCSDSLLERLSISKVPKDSETRKIRSQNEGVTLEAATKAVEIAAEFLRKNSNPKLITPIVSTQGIVFSTVMSVGLACIAFAERFSKSSRVAAGIGAVVPAAYAAFSCSARQGDKEILGQLNSFLDKIEKSVEMKNEIAHYVLEKNTPMNMSEGKPHFNKFLLGNVILRFGLERGFLKENKISTLTLSLRNATDQDSKRLLSLVGSSGGVVLDR